MIRINLLPGQKQVSKKRAAAGPSGSGLQAILLLIGFVVGCGVLFGLWKTNDNKIVEHQTKIRQLQTDKASLEQLKATVEGYEAQKRILDQRIAVIQDLQRNKVGGQELLDVIATTVTRTETLWLTSMKRKANGLELEGTAASVTAVANFITQLKRAGYFDRVEIKESHQDERNTAIQTFLFTLTADFVLPTTKPAAGAAAATPPAQKKS